MSGMEEFKITDQLKKIEEVLDQYDSNIGLDKIIYNEDVEEVLLLNASQLSSLDKSKLEEYSFLLAQYAAVLNKEINRNKARLYWAEDKLNRLIAQHNNKYSGQFMKFEIIKYTIINNDTAASKLNQIILHAQLRILEVDGVLNHIQMMSRLIGSIGRKAYD